MALIDRFQRRMYVWAWRVRFWWLDTESGAHAQVTSFCLAFLVLLVQLVRMAVATAIPAAHPAPQKAVVWWVVQIALALISAVVSWFLRPKTTKQPEQKQESPTVEDGLCVDDHFGEVWVDDPPILAWKVVRTEKIKRKGKK